MIKKVKYGVNKVLASAALLSLEMIVVMISFMLSIITVAWVIRRIFILGKEDIDLSVFQYLEGYISDSATSFMRTITIFGSHYFLIPAYLLLIAYFLFIRKHKWYSIKVPAVAISSLILMSGLKYLFQRHRPMIPLLHEVGGLSFPSGHAFMSFSFFGLLIYLSWRYVQHKVLKWFLIVFLLVFILLIGISRIYLRVHYASDVLAGFCLGLVWLVVSLFILGKLEKKSIDKVKISEEPAG